ncbi:hypothetical protein RIF29_06988 [Crotalaria pallida]|uniref:Uncharacterized protein n=1 Tax=Crotalaria pallida TaxID=3830 RepID=A0AAN9PB74_CROPI
MDLHVTLLFQDSHIDTTKRGPSELSKQSNQSPRVHIRRHQSLSKDQTVKNHSLRSLSCLSELSKLFPTLLPLTGRQKPLLSLYEVTHLTPHTSPHPSQHNTTQHTLSFQKP